MKNCFIKLIKTIVILTVVISYHTSLAFPILLDKVVAVVNNEVITWSDLYKMMEFETTDEFKSLSDEEKAKIFKENELRFLERLIDLRLQIQEAKKIGLEVTQEDIKETINSIKKKYNLTDAAFEESLKKEGLTLEEYKKRLSEQILLDQFLSRQIRNKIVITDEEIKNYVESNKSSFSSKEKYRLRQIFIKKPTSNEEITIANEKISKILERLKSGEDFASIAHDSSEDPSATTGGDTGFVSKEQMAKEFIDVLSKMKIGEISEPFTTEKGIHIIKLEDISPALSDGEIKEIAKKKLTEIKFTELYRKYLKELREKAQIQIRL